MTDVKPELSPEAYEYLAHFGVKGMRWGHRKSESSSKKTPRTSAEKKAIAKKVAIVTGTLVAVAGAAYVGHKLKTNGSAKISDIKVSDKSKAKVAEVLKDPTYVVHASRSKHKGFTFFNDGNSPSPLDELRKAFPDDVEQPFVRYEGKIASTFIDPEGRTDRAGRTIPHQVIIPKGMTEGINNVDDVVTKIWPLIKDHYDTKSVADDVEAMAKYNSL